MSEMIERVAMAIEQSFFGSPLRPEASLQIRSAVLDAARAAIAAMREPTDVMVVEGEYAVPALACFDDRANSPSCIAWHAMIDAALKE